MTKVRCQIVGCPDPEAERHTRSFVSDLSEDLEVVCENEYVQHLKRPDGRGIIVKHDLEENPYIKKHEQSKQTAQARRRHDGAHPLSEKIEVRLAGNQPDVEQINSAT